MSEVVGHGSESILRKTLAVGPTLDYIRTSLRAKVAFQYEVPNPRRHPLDSGDGAAHLQRVARVGHVGRPVGRHHRVKKTRLILAESERRFRDLA